MATIGLGYRKYVSHPLHATHLAATLSETLHLSTFAGVASSLHTALTWDLYLLCLHNTVEKQFTQARLDQDLCVSGGGWGAWSRRKARASKVLAPQTRLPGAFRVFERGWLSSFCVHSCQVHIVQQTTEEVDGYLSFIPKELLMFMVYASRHECIQDTIK